tara:strand:+ start:799 stop:975 length:177 start_codon:yes stop_codon:yes gene_type:complete
LPIAGQGRAGINDPAFFHNRFEAVLLSQLGNDRFWLTVKNQYVGKVPGLNAPQFTFKF